MRLAAATALLLAALAAGAFAQPLPLFSQKDKGPPDTQVLVCSLIQPPKLRARRIALVQGAVLP